MSSRTKQPTLSEAQGTAARSFLDSPAILALRLDWEKIAWIVLLFMALALRLFEVGARAMSHDESLHTLYSYNLYKGAGYQHDPLMHGPLLFEMAAFSYFLFGPSDFSARLPAALLGTGIVALMWFTRRWLSRPGAFLAALMLAVSPTMLYHSRYIRHDMFLIFFAVLMVVLSFRYLEAGESKWLIGLAVAMGLAFTTMEASFLYAIIFATFFLLWIAVRLLREPWDRQSYRWLFFAAFLIGAALAIYPLVEAIKAPVGAPVTSARLGGLVMWPLFVSGLAVVGVSFWLLVKGFGAQQLRAIREVDIAVWILTLAAPMYAAFLIKLFGGNPQEVKILSNMLQPVILKSAGVFLGMAILFGTVGFLWGRRSYLISLVLYYAIMIVLFTTFFTNGNGVGTGLVGSVGYWLAQQEVRRGGQPWYYYFLIVPLYEFLPLLLSILGMVVLGWRGLRRRALDPTGDWTGSGEASSPASVRAQSLLFLVWWILGVWAVFTWAGEKMPWLSTHFSTPLCILGGWFLAERGKMVDWAGVRSRRGWWFLLGLPVWLFALIAFLQLRPFRGSDLNGLSDTMSWLAALLLLAGLGFVLARKARELGWVLARRLAFFSLIGVIIILSVRTSFLANYVNYDYAIEPIVYAHATPDVKLIMNDLNEISRRTVGEGQLAFAYDDQSTWPFEWYFRDFPNKKFFGTTPSRDVLKDAPVVLIGTENEGKVKPYLADNYYRIPYRQIWWPKETYKDLTWQRIWDGVRDPVVRKNVLDVILYRRYQQPLADWDPSDRLLLFVRKDIASQVWNLGAAPASVAVEAPVDPFLEKNVLIPAARILGGVAGPEPGQFQQPRNMAVAPDGRIYVADTANHRIQVFNPDGGYVSTWGSFGEAQGQFNEPWGVAVGTDGRIYVLDTWNHRVQVFSPEGQFQKSWGAFVSTDGQLGEPGVFWGPRGIAVDGEGNLVVTDTGNKRVQVFDPEGNFVTQFGGAGLEPGQFDEPVGVAVGPDGSVFVADTWNQRIQKFDASYTFVKEWPVPGWADQNITTKPYIAVDSGGRVYASDPTGWRILVWDGDGNPVSSLGQYGAGNTDFGLPNGVFIAEEDSLWVADADNQRLMQFNPLP